MKLLDTTYLDINGISKHIGNEIDYNEKNPGFGLTFEGPRERFIKSLMVGRYKNSYGKQSNYIGGSIAKRWGRDYYADLGLMGGLATGYDKALQPIGGLLGQIGKKDLGRLRMILTPSADKADAVLMMNLGIPLK